MPCFVAAYAGDHWPPRNAKSEAMLMILPEPCSTMWRETSCPSSNGAVRLTATIGSHSSRPNSSTLASLQMPAEFTRMSMPPKRSTQVSATTPAAPASVMSISRNS